jgi:capsule polysaccharide export protein KpsE/RkpR
LQCTVATQPRRGNPTGNLRTIVALAARPPAMPLFSRSPKATADDLAALRAEVEVLRTELVRRTTDLSLVTAAANTFDQRIAALDARVASMTGEISAQLHELGGEIDRLASQAPTPQIAAAIDALQASQRRLANEQARYEIAFRQDLASIADALRRR